MWNYLSGVKYEMENEKDLSDSEIESDLEVFGKLFDFSKDLSIYCVDSSDHENVLYSALKTIKKFITRLNFCVLFIYFLFATHTN